MRCVLIRTGLWHLTARAASTNLSSPKVTTIYADKRSMASWHVAAGYLGTHFTWSTDTSFWYTVCLSVFLHELSGQALAGKKKSLPWELTQLGARCNFCGLGSSVAKSNLWIIIYKRQPNSELVSQHLVSPYVDKLLWKHDWVQIEEKVNKMLRMWPTERKPVKCLPTSTEVGFFSCQYVDKNTLSMQDLRAQTKWHSLNV